MFWIPKHSFSHQSSGKKENEAIQDRIIRNIRNLETTKLLRASDSWQSS